MLVDRQTDRQTNITKLIGIFTIRYQNDIRWVSQNTTLTHLISF